MELGEFNELYILRFRKNGCYLGKSPRANEIEDDNPFGEGVLLPQQYVTKHMKVGDKLKVFLYTDSNDRIVATTEHPKILLHEFAPLKVKSVTHLGAFMDWGLSKDLFVPFAEQFKPLVEGHTNVVFLYLDADTERLVGTTKIESVIDNEVITVGEREETRLLIFKETPLGYKAIINNENIGLLYRTELNRMVKIGEYHTGYVKKIRSDKKIDLSLEQQGVDAIEPIAKLLLRKIRENKGYIPYHDKSDPKAIRHFFGISKKLFKKAAGLLYKKKLIRIEEDGLYLLVEEIQ